MITRRFDDILSAWHGVVNELAYNSPKAINWGMHAAYPDILEIKIDDALADNGLDFGMSSYTKGRWTSFLRKYFRPDYATWIDGAMVRLKEAPHRPYVAAYSMNVSGEPTKREAGRRNFSGGPRAHNYGSCLSSLQLRIKPEPRVILYSRACALDKTGFLDLSLIHLTAKRTGLPKIGATWIISLGFISAISQIFYIHRFKKPLKGHALQKRVTHLIEGDDDHNYGPLKRIMKRKGEFSEHGKVLGSCMVRDLSLEFKTLDK